MKNPTKILALSLLSSLVLTGCSKKEEITEDDVKAAADEAAKQASAETEKKMDDKLASGLASLKKDSKDQIDSLKKESEDKIAAAKADMEKKMEDEKAKLQAEMEAKLAEQTATVKKQFISSTSALKSQYDSLKSKYDSLKDKLPEDTVKQISAKLPAIASSLGNLEGITNKFNPSSLEQLKDLQTKYQSEIAVAKKVADEVLKLLGKGSLNSMLPKL